METPQKYLKNAIGYVHHKNKEEISPLFLDGNGIDPTSPKNAYNQMMAVKEYYSKTSGNPLVHLIVSYDKETAPDAETACQLTKKIAEYYKETNISLFSVRMRLTMMHQVITAILS